MADTSATTTLSSTYTNLINYQIQLESQPLTRLEDKKTELNTMKAVYADLKIKLESLKSSSKALLSSDPFYALKEGKSISITPGDSEKTVASASVSSAAVAGSYTISNIVLAKNHKVRSDVQEYSDQALSKTGTFIIGGASERAFVKNTSGEINFGTTPSIELGQKELGTGTYYVETRKNTSGEWQFRLVDGEGNAVKTKTGENTYSVNWQNIPTGGGSYDTGRGLTIEFGSNPDTYVAATKSSGAESVSYTAKGAEINVTSDMSLVDIADAINNGVYGSGNEVSATIINKQLIISAKNTGSAHSIMASGTILEDLGILSGSSFKNVMQTAGDASFKVEGMSVTRSNNTGLSDVIAGVTLNLASDAEGQTATINIKADSTAMKSAVNSFVTNFNALQSYLTGKMAVTKNADDTYTRGQLSGDQSLSSLRYNLMNLFTKYDATGGIYKSMREIGITAVDSTTLGITNDSDLTTALTTRYSEVTAIFDRVMKSMTDSLSKFSGKTAYVDQMISATEDQTENVTDQIEKWNTRLDQKRAYLTKQYVEVQSQMTLLSYQQSTNSSWISSLNIYS